MVYETRHARDALLGLGPRSGAKELEELGFGDWELLYWDYTDFSFLPTDEDGDGKPDTYLLAVESHDRPNGPRGWGRIEIDAEGVWTRFGSAE